MILEADELYAEMGGFQPTEEQDEHVKRVILPGVQGQLETWLGRTVERVHMRETSVFPDDNGMLIVSNSPIFELLHIWDAQGNVVELPPAPTTPIPDMASIPGYPRRIEQPRAGCSSFGVYVGGGGGIRYDLPYGGYGPWGGIIGGPVNTFLGGVVPAYTLEYIGGLHGIEIPNMKSQCVIVAARWAERQFDDSMSIKGGSQDAAADSDDRVKGWTEEELQQFDRHRRRNIV